MQVNPKNPFNEISPSKKEQEKKPLPLAAKIALSVLGISAVAITAVIFCHIYHLEAIPILYSIFGVSSVLALMTLMILGCKKPKPSQTPTH